MKALFETPYPAICAVLGVFLSSCMSTDAPRGGMVLARDGEALAEIVTAASPAKAAGFAAAELKWHLDKITGADFRIVTEDAVSSDKIPILVGRTSLGRFDAGGFSRQEFVIDVRDGAVELLGVDDAAPGNAETVHFANGAVASDESFPEPYSRCGTTYAVYGFLEDVVGVKWLDPTDYGTIVPGRRTLEVPFSSTRASPAFQYRGGSFRDGFCPAFWKPSGGAPAESAGYEKYMDFAFGGRGSAYSRTQMKLYLIRRRAFGERADANHSFYGWYDRFLKMDDPDNEAFEEYRPEYFAKNPGSTGRPPQLCYTDPGVIERVVSDAREYFDGPRGKRRWGEDCYCLEPMDNADFCRCARCVAQYEPERARDNSQHSTYWFGFVNKVARELAATHPGKRINTLAYLTHEGVPTDMEMEENVTVYFCLFNNRMPYLDNALGRQTARLKEWTRRYPGRRFALWLYNTFPKENYNYSGVIGVPGFFAHHAEKQFDLFGSADFSQGVYHCGMDGSVDSYLQFRWMLDPSLRADDMLEEYFSACGAAAGPLREFYDTVEERYCSAAYRPSGMSLSSLECLWEHVCPPSVMRKLASLMEEAEKAVAGGTETEKARVRLFGLEVWDYMRAGARQYEMVRFTAQPCWYSARIGEAAGDIEKADWNGAGRYAGRLFFAGGELASPVKASFSFANDSTHLYIEVEAALDTKELSSHPHIAYRDDIELYFAVERGACYRAYFSSPDGRMRAGDFGDGKWGAFPRGAVRPSFGAKCVSDTSRDGIWRTRYSFPLENLAEKPLKPGDGVFLNIASVLDPRHVGRPGNHAVLVATPYSYTHDTRRTGTLLLAR